VPNTPNNDDGTLSFGEPQTRDATLQLAVAKVDSALTFARANGEETQEHLAQIGKARALLSLGRFVDAGAAVAGVPTSFVFNIEGSTNSTRQNNGIWNYTFHTNAFSVSDEEGGNGMPFISAADPRVETEDLGDVGFDGETPFTLQLKYPRLDSDAPLATGIEARLIEAEAALRAGNAAGFIGKVNEARAAAGLDAVSNPSSQTAREDLLFRERAFSLYLTSHRLGDLRRLVRQYGRDQADVFPSGPYHKGGNYGSDVNIPVSGDEQNNPNFSACLDRGA
jgi:hypothetical protein